jgi:type I restriction enzyme R subunit
MNKKTLTEADIRTKFITPAIIGANVKKWDVMTQILEEHYFTKGRVIVRGKTVKRGEATISRTSPSLSSKQRTTTIPWAPAC